MAIYWYWEISQESIIVKTYKGVSPNLFLAFTWASNDPDTNSRVHSNEPAIAAQCRQTFISLSKIKNYHSDETKQNL